MSSSFSKAPLVFIAVLSTSFMLASIASSESDEPALTENVTEITHTESEESEPTLAEAMTKISQLTFLVSELGIIVDKLEAERSATEAWCSANPGISLCEVLGYY